MQILVVECACVRACVRVCAGPEGGGCMRRVVRRIVFLCLYCRDVAKAIFFFAFTGEWGLLLWCVCGGEWHERGM